MGIHLGRVGHIGIHVSDVDRSIEFYRKVLGLKVTGRWGPPDFGRPICFMRINDKHHDVVLFELSEGAKKAGMTSTDSRIRREPGLVHGVPGQVLGGNFTTCSPVAPSDKDALLTE